MAQMQPSLDWNAVVIIAHPVLRLAMKDLLYYVSDFIQLFIIKWELCSTSVRFSDWKGQLLVSKVQSHWVFRDKIQTSCADMQLQELKQTSHKLCSVNPEDWAVVLTSLELEYHSYSCQGGRKLCYSKFFVPWLFLYSSSRPSSFQLHLWRCQGIERLQEWK